MVCTRGKFRTKFDAWVAGCEQESRRKTYGQPVWLNHESPQGRDGETDTRVLTLETILEPVAKACAIWGTTDQLQGCTKKTEIRDSAPSESHETSLDLPPQHQHPAIGPGTYSWGRDDN